MSASDVSRASAELERRYGRVLRLYPAEYRRERGPELMATLLEAAEGGKRPELAGLIVGALRAHAGQERRSVRSSWLMATRIAAVMLLVTTVASTPLLLAAELAKGVPGGWWLLQMDTPDLAAAPFGLVSIIAVLRRRYRVAAGAAVTAFVVGIATIWLAHQAMQGGLVCYLFVVLLLLPLPLEAPRPARGVLRYLPLAALLIVVAQRFVGNFTPGPAELVLTGVICAAALVWAVVDERVTIAVGLLLMADFLYFVVAVMAAVYQGRIVGPDPSTLLYLAAIAGLGPTVLLIVSGLAARRQAHV
jgi:hypothetical protein